jgi:S-DNA-T family DNA segregation ATPase FtsK/SpoIIIE
LGGSVYKNSYDELSGDKNDTKPVIHKNIEIQQEADKLEQLTPPISFLTDTGIDNYFENKSRAEKYQQTLTKFIRKLSLDAAYRDTVIMPQYTEINFEVASKSQIDDILKAQSELLHVLQVEAFNISFKGNIVMFEIPNKKVSKISMRQIFNSMASIQNDEAIAGMGFDNAPLLIDINKHSNMMIIGRRGSGAAMLLTTMLISLAYLNSPKSLEMTILSPLGDRSLKYFDSLPHMQYPLITDLEECLIKLHDLLKQIEERETKFKDAGAKTLEEFNKYQSTESSRFKTSILAISSFDHLLKNSLQNIQLLHEILTRGPSVGIRTILLSINVNNETIEPKIFDVISARFILRLESEHESLKLFDNYRGIQLSGNGDGYYFDVKSNKKNRFQTCYLNVNELMETIKIIKTFYSTKDRSN